MDAIDNKTIQHNGFDIRIDVLPYSDSTPYDADCYDDADIEAWRNDEWFYVGYIYTATLDGIELGSASIWGSEWDFPGGIDSIDGWIAENYYHSDLLAEATDEARATLTKLAAHTA